MKNIWLNYIDRALIGLGYNVEQLDTKTKEAVIIDEYLYRMKDDTEDIAPFCLDDMAKFLLRCQKSPVQSA